jgi:hypothetical protein
MSGSVQIYCVPPVMLGAMWGAISKHLLRAVMQAEPDIEFAEGDLRKTVDRILDGQFSLWVVMADHPKRVLGTFCTSIFIEDGSRWVHGHTLAGEHIEKWGHLLAPAMDAYVKQEGCRGLRYEGRKAWTKYLPARSLGVSNGVEEFERSVLQ